jgi:transposase
MVQNNIIKKVRRASKAPRRRNFPEQRGTILADMPRATVFPEQRGTAPESYLFVTESGSGKIRSNEGQDTPIICEPCDTNAKNHREMAGKITAMSKIKQALLLHQQGYSIRKIAETLGGISKNTINNYINQKERLGCPIEDLLSLSDPELEKKFHQGNPAYTDKRMDTFLSELPYYRKELANRHVTRQLLWEEYRKRYPDGYGKSQFFYHLKQNLVAERSQTAVLTETYVPGEKLYVDFSGDKLYYVDEYTGEIHKVETFVATMPYSDYGFAVCVENQSTENFLHALRMCLEHLGGVPKIVVTDNLKASVVKADRYEPEISRAMEDFGNHYHFVSIPCQPRRPTEKALVENHVKMVYRRVYAKLRHNTFFSLHELNAAAYALMEAHNRTRMQRHPYSREENFHANERPKLQPLPEREFEMTCYSEAKVQANGYVQLQRSKVVRYYSVPYQYIGKKALLAYTNSIVQVYIDGRCVATHAREYRYGYSTVPDHLPSNNRVQLSKSPEYYSHKAHDMAEQFGAYVDWLFSQDSLRGNPPEVRYRTCDMLLGLSRRCPLADFIETCEICLSERISSGKQFDNILRNLPLIRTADDAVLPEPSGENMRGADYFF